MTTSNGGGPIIPDYSGPNVRGIIPALLGPAPWATGLPDWFPAPVAHAEQAVLLVLDGLGWDQLEAHRHLMPTLSSMTGGPIHTVAPTTTATALSSIATGLTPAEHGLIGYRMVLGGEIMNVLRWTVGEQAVRRSHPPREVQPFEPFLGQSGAGRQPDRTAELGVLRSPSARLDAARLARAPARSRSRRPNSWRRGSASCTATTAASTRSPTSAGSARTTRPSSAPPTAWSATSSTRVGPGTAVLVTADHGQVHVADRILRPSAEMLAPVAMQSGEGRFRWLHAQSGAIARGRRGGHRGGRRRGLGRHP